MPSAAPPSLFDQLGGEPALRALIDRFVERLFSDLMIGFFFQRASKERIKEKEYEFAARHLGANIEYTGRPLEAAHRPHRIFDGQFQRRLTLLRETLDQCGAPTNVRNHFLSHTLSLRDRIIVGKCEDPLPNDPQPNDPQPNDPQPNDPQPNEPPR
ncbi:MAG: group 1 truncated hemoglobin [Polyangiaceae bacterium]